MPVEYYICCLNILKHFFWRGLEIKRGNANDVYVLLSAFKPNLKFFAEQLDSIDKQTYPITLLVRNDCPESPSLECFIRAHIKNNAYQYYHGEKNLGYVKSFEELLSRAKGEFVVFCDQDDIWEPDRVEVSLNQMIREGSILDVCDRSEIDENGNTLVDSYRKAHPNSPEVNWHSGEDITVQAASVCYGIGMALMLNEGAAKSLIPFPESTAHDLWLTLGCSELGKCSFTMVPLVKYRRHGDNETGFLAGIASKEDWYSTRVKNRIDTAKQFAERFPNSPHLKDIMGFADARERRSIVGLIKYRRACPSIAKAEIALRLMPNWLFALFLYILKLRNSPAISSRPA